MSRTGPLATISSVSFVLLLTSAFMLQGARATAGEGLSTEHPCFLPPEPAAVPRQHPGRYVPGGRNVEAHRYVVSEGFPPIPDRARFVGVLTGSWFDMGQALGARAGDGVRCTSDIWWKRVCDKKGKANTLKAMTRYEEQIAALDPNQIEFIRGIAKGAAPWLNQSPYADANHSLHAENYQRIFAAGIWDCWLWGRPELAEGACNSFAALGDATVDGKTVSTQSQHTRHDGLCYLQAYIIKPPTGNVVWTVSSTPNICGLMLVNDKGVSISHHFGGSTTPRSLEHSGGPYYANAFGVPWWNLVLHSAIHANTAEEAVDMLTVGPAEYRQKTGRKAVLRDGAWNWMVADSDTLAVVEASADRYAVRYAGEHLGADWTDKTFIACANHFLCDFSYDAENRRTNVPMTIFNVGEKASEERFWTLMWEIKKRLGRIDKYAAQHVLGTTYVRNKDTGDIIECAQAADGAWHVYAHAKRGIQGTMEQCGLASGTNTARVAVLDGPNSTVSWTLGNPSDWQGAWDEYFFNPEGWMDWQWWTRQ